MTFTLRPQAIVVVVDAEPVVIDRSSHHCCTRTDRAIILDSKRVQLINIFIKS